MITAGLIAAAGLLFLLLKLGPRKVIGNDILVDIFVTGMLMLLLSGTYSGMMAALFGGLVTSILLFIAKRTMTHEVLTIVRTSRFPFRAITWITVTP